MGDPFVLDNPCSKRMSAFANELKNRGHEVVILVPDTPGVEYQEGVVYCKTPPLEKKTTINRLKNQGVLALRSLKEGKRITDVDVVLTTCPPPLINIAGARIAKKHKAKLIYDVRDIWPDVALEMGSFPKGSIYERVFADIRDYMLNHADLVTAVSNGKVNKLKGYAPKQDIVCIPNGYNTAFSEVPINEELYREIRARGECICTYIGNIGLAQGIQQLLDLAEKSKEEEVPVYFLIYGSGAEEEKLRQYVIDHNMDNISFEGRLPNKDMRTVLEACDINFVSLVNGNLRDSIPTKMYEALGVGCPVLLVAEGDSAAILNDTGLGVSVSPNDKAALWDSFRYMYDNLEKINQKKEQTIELMKTKYSLQESAKKIAAEMERLVEYGTETIYEYQ
jgi:glycosyltransferase involved in cell wall biosynthesis